MRQPDPRNVRDALLQAGYSDEQVDAALHVLNSVAHPLQVEQTLSRTTEFMWPPDTSDAWVESAIDRMAHTLGRELVSKGYARVAVDRNNHGERRVRIWMPLRKPIGYLPEGLRGPWTWREMARKADGR